MYIASQTNKKQQEEIHTTQQQLLEMEQERDMAQLAAQDAQRELLRVSQNLQNSKTSLEAAKAGRSMFEAGCLGATIAFVKHSKGQLDSVKALLGELEIRVKWHNAGNGNMQSLNDLPAKIAELRKTFEELYLNLQVADQPKEESPSKCTPSKHRENVETEQDAQALKEQLRRSVERERKHMQRIQMLEQNTRFISDEQQLAYMDMVLQSSESPVKKASAHSLNPMPVD